jgi:hypothetical protein
MDLLTSIFEALMRMTPHKTDTESKAERAARMHIVADSINNVTKRAACTGLPVEQCRPIFSDRRLLASLLLGKGHFESDFAQYVHEGHCDQGPVGARCDSDRFGVARAHGPWQQWKLSVFPQADWDAMHASTPEATELAAWHAAKLLAGSRAMCKQAFAGDEIQAAIAGFSGSCTMGMAPKKVAYQAAAVRKILATLPAE